MTPGWLQVVGVLRIKAVNGTSHMRGAALQSRLPHVVLSTKVLMRVMRTKVVSGITRVRAQDSPISIVQQQLMEAVHVQTPIVKELLQADAFHHAMHYRVKIVRA